MLSKRCWGQIDLVCSADKPFGQLAIDHPEGDADVASGLLKAAYWLRLLLNVKRICR